VFRSVNTYKAGNHGQGQNSDGPQDYGDDGLSDDMIGNLADQSILAPGFIDLPVCRFMEARDNYEHWGKAGSDYGVTYCWPCNKVIDYEKEWNGLGSN
jgi:hypothetical protein